jgi:hypothetical protein
VEATERTRDLYEKIAGYPEPPLVPLPESDDWEVLEGLDLRSSHAARLVVRAAMLATGFDTFRKELPVTIENLLRQCDLRGGYLRGPVVSATLALIDDPREQKPISRAATLLWAARGLYQEVASGRLRPDEWRGQALEMGQYPNLFSTSLIVEGKEARLFKSTDVAHVIVAVGGRFYRLDVGEPGSDTTVDQLDKALTDIVARALACDPVADDACIGVLTAADHTTQLEAFEEIQRDPANAAGLTSFRHSFVTLCLDLDHNPTSEADAALFTHSRNFANRWYRSSLQIVVFGNARACAICSFSAYLDGHTMMRAGSELQQRAANCPLVSRAKRGAGNLPPAVELSMNVRPALIRRAYQDLELILDHQQATFDMEGLGRDTFSAHNVDPVPAFVLGLQLATKRLLGRTASVAQFLSMSKYRCMDLVTANVTTPEAMSFVDYLDSDQVQSDRTMTLLGEAIDSQTRECRRVRRCIPMSDVVSLFQLSRKGAQQKYVNSVLVVTGLLLRLLGQFDPARRREVVISHPEIYPEVTIVGRPGVRLPYVKYFGLHYQMLPGKTVVTLMPSVNWNVPNVELIAQLRAGLERIQSCL